MHNMDNNLPLDSFDHLDDVQGSNMRSTLPDLEDDLLIDQGAESMTMGLGMMLFTAR